MAITYRSIANTPCAVIQNATALLADGVTRLIRVGDENCPLPPEWAAGEGSPSNPVFFDKIKAAARRIAGVATDAGLSGLSIPCILFLATGPNTTWENVLVASGFPNGQLLTAPLIEQIGLSDTASNSPTIVCSGLIFETRVEGPRYCDFVFTVTAATGNLNFVIKLFHSLTM